MCVIGVSVCLGVGAAHIVAGCGRVCWEVDMTVTSDHWLLHWIVSQVTASLRACDGVVLVVDAVEGVMMNVRNDDP